MKVLLIMCFLLSPIVSASVTKEKDVSVFTWGGVSAYIAVNRNKVQTKLNDINQSRPGGNFLNAAFNMIEHCSDSKIL